MKGVSFEKEKKTIVFFVGRQLTTSNRRFKRQLVCDCVAM